MAHDARWQMPAKSKRPRRELHDAFENDIDLDLSGMAAKGTGPAPQAEKGDLAARRELIERVVPSVMIPDRFQPRPILPGELQARFFRGELDCYQVADAWLQLAASDLGHQERVAELMRMADSVGAHGQIKPITGSWVAAEDGSYRFQIETGERRFWGACLKAAVEGGDQEPLLRVEAVEAPSVERQIIENRHAQPPTVVAQAREIAALLLKKMGLQPDPGMADPYDYFRQALDPPGRQRLPRGIWEAMEPVMQVTPRRMRQILSVLRMPTGLLEQADRYNLSDRVLQVILAAPERDWARLLEAAIAEELTGAQLRAEAEKPERGPQMPKPRRKPRDHTRSALRGLRGFSGALARAGERNRAELLDSVADELVVQDDAPAILGILEELSNLVRARLAAREEPPE
jgi:hypothetical protein